MPQGTAVENAYQVLRKKGYDKGMAARIAQSQTGEALATGRPPRHHAVATANELVGGPDLGVVPSSQRTTQAQTLSPGQKILQEARQATSAAEAASGLMKLGPDGVYECPTCHYRADSPRPHNCQQILNRQQRNSPGWSGGFRMPR
jgi:hypothetical protein